MTGESDGRRVTEGGGGGGDEDEAAGYIHKCKL